MESYVFGSPRGTTQKQMIPVEIQEKNDYIEQLPGIFL
jgi:hypothetical protein